MAFLACSAATTSSFFSATANAAIFIWLSSTGSGSAAGSSGSSGFGGRHSCSSTSSRTSQIRGRAPGVFFDPWSQTDLFSAILRISSPTLV